MNKLFSLTVIAILLALIALGFAILRITPCEITTETYIGALATLLGIIVTVVTAYQIWSTIDVRERVKEIEQIKKTLEETEAKLKIQGHRLLAEMRYDTGRTMEEFSKFDLALKYYIAGVTESLLCGDMNNVQAALDKSEEVLGKCETGIEKVIKFIDKEVLSSPHADKEQFYMTIKSIRKMRDKLDEKLKAPLASKASHNIERWSM